MLHRERSIKATARPKLRKEDVPAVSRCSSTRIFKQCVWMTTDIFRQPAQPVNMISIRLSSYR